MKNLFTAIDKIPLGVLVILCATLGLAPFSPPHVAEKLFMLVNGTLVKPVDWFDLCLHGTPWLLLILKLVAMKMAPVKKPESEK